MIRKKFVCGNWKLHKTVAESVELALAVERGLLAAEPVEVAVAPVFTALHAVAEKLDPAKVALAAQDCFWEDEGAWTGEVSARLLADVGCRYVIIAHSERRQHCGETDASANRKVKAVLRQGLRPILCVGETLTERDGDRAFSVVQRQLAGGLAGLSAGDAEQLVIAYEPVWAIGTGRTATPDQAQTMHHFIRSKLLELFGDVANAMRIQYGGSVKPENARQLLEQPDIDGALVGGAALKADDFLRIVKYRNT